MAFIDYIVVKRDDKLEASVRLAYQSIIVMMFAIILEVLAWFQPYVYYFSLSTCFVALIAVIIALDSNRILNGVVSRKPLEPYIAFWGSLVLFMFIVWDSSYLIAYALTSGANC